MSGDGGLEVEAVEETFGGVEGLFVSGKDFFDFDTFSGDSSHGSFVFFDGRFTFSGRSGIDYFGEVVSDYLVVFDSSNVFNYVVG